VTNLEGDASIVSLEDNMNIVKHETIETNERSNVADNAAIGSLSTMQSLNFLAHCERS
jgi:hypothetical protein